MVNNNSKVKKSNRVKKSAKVKKTYTTKGNGDLGKPGEITIFVGSKWPLGFFLKTFNSGSHIYPIKCVFASRGKYITDGANFFNKVKAIVDADPNFVLSDELHDISSEYQEVETKDEKGSHMEKRPRSTLKSTFLIMQVK